MASDSEFLDYHGLTVLLDCICDKVAVTQDMQKILTDLESEIDRAQNIEKTLHDTIEDVKSKITGIEDKVNGADLTGHTDNKTIHITESERTSWNSAVNAASWLPSPGYDLIGNAKSKSIQIYSSNPNRKAAQGVPSGFSEYGLYICIGKTEYITMLYIDVFGVLATWSQNAQVWVPYKPYEQRTCWGSANIDANGNGVVNLVGIPDSIINSAKGVIVTLNHQWGTAGVLNATLNKTTKSVLIKTNIVGDGVNYNIPFAILLVSYQ